MSSSGERAPLSRSPSVCAIVEATSDGSRIGARATKWTPSSKRGAARAASSSARRVLPVPPGPVIVISGLPCPLIMAARSASSGPRPTRARRGSRQALRPRIDHRGRRRRPGGLARERCGGGGCELAGVSEAVAGFLGEAVLEDGVEGREGEVGAGEWGWGILDVGPDGGDVGIAREGGNAGEQLVEKAGERVDVGGGGGLAVLDRFGGEVVDACRAAGRPRSARLSRRRWPWRCRSRSGRRARHPPVTPGARWRA